MARQFFTATLLLLLAMAGAAGLLALSIMISMPLTIMSVLLIVVGFVPLMNIIA